MTGWAIVFSVLGALFSIGALAGGVGYLVGQFKKGSKQDREDILTSSEQLSKFWQDQAEGFKSMMATKEKEWNDKDRQWNERFTDLTREVGTIKGQLTEKEKQANQYLEILQNRDPATKKFMELMTKAMEDQSIINKDVVGILKEIHAAVIKPIVKNE